MNNHKILKTAALACVAFLLAGCAGMTAAETTAVMATGGGALVGIIEAMSPYLPPAKVAELSAHVYNAEGIIGAVSQGLAAVAQAAQQAQQQAQEASAHSVSPETTTAMVLGGGAVATAASRYLSSKKHAPAKAVA